MISKIIFILLFASLAVFFYSRLSGGYERVKLRSAYMYDHGL